MPSNLICRTGIAATVAAFGAALLLVASVLAPSASAAHALGFDAAYGYSGSYSDNVAFGDFNADGAIDYATANWSGFYSRYQFEVRLGNGTGGFPTSTLYNLSAADPVCVAVTDFDEDGLDDVVVLCNIRVEVHLNTGSGFALGVSAVSPSGPTDMAVGDFDGDGHDDVVVAYMNAHKVAVLLGDGTGGLGSPVETSLKTSTITSPYARYLTVADFDGDGCLDVATNTTYGTNMVAVAMGEGDGSFAGPAYYSVGAGPEELCAADIDEDGDADLVVPCDFNTNVVSILWNDGTGGFTSSKQIVPVSNARPRDVAAADLNGDGHLDLVVADGNVLSLHVMPGDGAGNFATLMTMSSNYGILDVTTVEANGDGRLDIVTAVGMAIRFHFADTQPPVSSNQADADWHASPYSFGITAVDQNGALGSGVDEMQYSLSPDGPWIRGGAATVSTWKRGGGSGVRTVYYRAIDRVGNVEAPKSVTVRVDGRAPFTTSDAPVLPVAGPVTVLLSATDAHSGVAGTWYSVDGGDWRQGASLVVDGVGTHWLFYYSVDNVGNMESVRVCSVNVTAGGAVPARAAAKRRALGGGSARSARPAPRACRAPRP